MIPWAVLITGAAGVGGTALGAWLTGRLQIKNLRLNITAENERADRAEKRQVYARSLTAFSEMSMTVTAHRAAKMKAHQDPEGWVAIQSRLERATDAMYEATSVMRLAAAPEIADLADRLREAHLDYVEATRQGAALGSGPHADAIGSLRQELDQAMRADLDQPSRPLPKPLDDGRGSR